MMPPHAYPVDNHTQLLKRTEPKIVRTEGLTSRDMQSILTMLNNANPEQLLKVANEAMARTIGRRHNGKEIQ